MILIYESQFQKDFFEKEKKRIYVFEQPATEYFTESTFKNEMLTVTDMTAEFFRKNSDKPQQMFIDMREFRFVVSPELQEWHAKTNFTKYLEMGISQVAILVSQDFFAKISVEQSFEENIVANSIIQYFEDENEALAWLNSKL